MAFRPYMEIQISATNTKLNLHVLFGSADVPVSVQVLSALVTFMDGVHTELGVMRNQLGKLEASGRQAATLPLHGAPVFASDVVHDSTGRPQGLQGVGMPASASAMQAGGLQGDRADAAGSGLLYPRHPHQQGGETSAEGEGEGGGGQQVLYEREGGPQVKGWWGGGARHLSREQAAGLAAAIGSGVGAVVGALLMAYFSSR